MVKLCVSRSSVMDIEKTALVLSEFELVLELLPGAEWGEGCVWVAKVRDELRQAVRLWWEAGADTDLDPSGLLADLHARLPRDAAFESLFKLRVIPANLRALSELRRDACYLAGQANPRAMQLVARAEGSRFAEIVEMAKRKGWSKQDIEHLLADLNSRDTNGTT